MPEQEETQIPERRIVPLWPRVESARWSLGPLLALSRDLLVMDLAMLNEVVGDQEAVRRADGAWPGLDVDLLPGSSLRLTDTFCQRLLEGSLPPYVRDVENDPTTADLALARAFGVGAWIGARIPTSGAGVYVLCCLARESRPGLGQRDVHALNTLATSLANQIDTTTLGP